MTRGPVALGPPAIGVGERTAFRRLAEPGFKFRVAGLRGEMVARAVGKLADGMSEVGDVLRRLLAAESESVRLGSSLPERTRQRVRTSVQRSLF